MSLGLESLELVSLWMVSGWLGSRETSERAWLAPGGLSGSFRGQGIETSSDLVRVLDLLIRVGYLVAPAWLHRTHRRLLCLLLWFTTGKEIEMIDFTHWFGCVKRKIIMGLCVGLFV